jgi:hypothetical protein
MTHWVLIIIVMSWRDAPAISTARFETRGACIAAGDAVQATLKDRASMVTVCAPEREVE